jgi:preprotein translocase subunit SecD
MKAALDKNLNDMVQTFRADLREDQIRYRNVQADISRGQVQIT